jgi:hypothetical protein
MALDESVEVEFVAEPTLVEVVPADAIEPVTELSMAEVLVPIDDVEVVVGMKSTIVIVCCKSKSGAGASSKVLLKLVEQAVFPLQQAHELVLELYVKSLR